MDGTVLESQGFFRRSLKSILLIPLRAALLFLKHPIAVCLIALIAAWLMFSTLAHFNPEISKRFNNAVTYFGAATVASIAADSASAAIALAEKRAESNLKLRADLDAKRGRVKALEASNVKMKNQVTGQATHIDELNVYIKGQNQKLNSSAGKLKTANSKLEDIDARLKRFQQRGRLLATKAGRKLTKVALVDSAGELIGWVPVVGDIASLGLTAGGIYEMCQMFREIEEATTELGVTYQVYTDTFCQKPVAKTREMVTKKGADIWGYLGDRVFYTQQYWVEKSRNF